MAWGAVIAAGASLAGGVMSQMGANDRNNAQIGAAREQMDFQERMSNTAYQRAMADMRAAGLNPILAYQKGGASTPGGAMPNMENEMGGWGPALSGAANSAMSAYRTEADVDNTLEDTGKKVTESDLNRAAKAKVEMDTVTSATQAELNKSSADYQKEAAINAKVQNQILQHDVTSASGQARLRTREAEDVERYGTSKLGVEGAAVERIIRRIFNSVAGNGGGVSPTTTPIVPSPKEDSKNFFDRERARKIGEPR